ncbi:6432_t:CDS:10 [Entrophospora sp. SA101]|nr:6432_t:CDS:10 [Entrophospora sp. SA101]
MANRKLQTEIDRVLKRVSEGVETFEAIFDKIQAAINSNQKEKLEQDLKKEIKKLQRQRDQIKAWISSNDIKDKRALIDNRRLIEQQMEKFKACEKEMKTKAYSKEGLQQSVKMDPKEKEKMETCEFVASQIDILSAQIETAEAEAESLQSAVKKGRKDIQKVERLTEVDHLIERNKWHVNRLELILRLLENGNICPEKVIQIQEDIKYYVESNQEPEFAEDENIYEDLNLEEEEELYAIAIANEEHHSSHDSVTDEPWTPQKEARINLLYIQMAMAFALIVPAYLDGPMVTVPKNTVPLPSRKSSNANESLSTWLKEEDKPKPPSILAQASTSDSVVINLKSPPPTFPSLKTTSNSGPTAATTVMRTIASVAKQASLQSQTNPPSPIQQSQQTQFRPTTIDNDIKKDSSNDSIEVKKQGFSQSKNDIQTNPLESQQYTPKDQGTLLSPPQHYHPQHRQQPTASNSSSIQNSIDVGANINNQENQEQHDNQGSSSSKDKFHIQQMLDTSLQSVPETIDAERPKYYTPRNPYHTPPYYPQTPYPIFDNPALFEKFDIDTLFFIFYYQQGTYQQYLAARELKKQSWRFHKKYLTWFQRHEEPKSITDEYEQGTYIYFDYEGAWCQRKKTEFRFEYRFLEDAELM